MDLQAQKATLVVKSLAVEAIMKLLDCECIIKSLLKDYILVPDVWKEELQPPVNKARKIALNISAQLRELMYALDDIYKM